MKPQGQRVVALAVLASIGLVAGGIWQWQRAAGETAWAESVPEIPDVAALPAEFGARLADLTVRARSRVGAVDALGELGRLYHANGFSGEAARAYAGLERFDAGNARWPHLHAHLLAGAGQLEVATPRWRRAGELAPEYAPAHVRLGEALLKTNQPEAAEAAYAVALALEPGNPHALLGLARAGIRQERWTEARERLQAAVAAEPEFGAAWHLLATVYQRLGNDAGFAAAQVHADGSKRFREMSDPWLDALLEDCYDEYRLRVAASSALASGDPNAAVPLLERAARFAPRSSAVHQQFGDVFLEMGRLVRARAAFERAIALEPTNASAHESLVTCLASAGLAEAAGAAAAAGVEQCPDSAALWFVLGRHRLAAGESEAALAAFAHARDLRPEMPDAYHEIAGIHFRHGREQAGVAVLEGALARVAEPADTLLALARRAVETGDEAAAARWLEQARSRGAVAAGGVAEISELFQRRFGRMP
jgi:tetratricopeptide (TPR) repeat protein